MTGSEGAAVVTEGAELRPAAYGASGNGRTDDATALEVLALRVVPETGGTLVLSAPHRVGRDLDLPAHVALRFEAGGRLVVDRGRRVVLRGAVEGGDVPLFGGAGTVSLGEGSPARASARWWGAAGDGAADDTEALQAALDALPAAGGRLRVPAGVYRVSAPLRIAGRTGWEVAFEEGASLRHEGAGFALEVRGSSRWLLRDLAVALGPAAAGGVRVRASSRGLLHRARVVAAAGEVAAGCVGVATEDAALLEVHAPVLRGAFAEGVRLAGRSDGSRVVGGEVRGAVCGVRVDDCDAVTVDGTSFVEVGTGIAVSAPPGAQASGPFTAISARFERVGCGVEIRSVPGRGRVFPPVLSDLRYADGVALVRCLPGVAYRLIAPVQVAAREPESSPAPEAIAAAVGAASRARVRVVAHAEARARRWSASRSRGSGPA